LEPSSEIEGFRFSMPEISQSLQRFVDPDTERRILDAAVRASMTDLCAGRWDEGEHVLGLVWDAVPEPHRAPLLDIGCVLAHRRADGTILAHRAALWEALDRPHDAAFWRAQALTLSDPNAGLEALDALHTQPDLSPLLRAHVTLATSAAAGLAGITERWRQSATEAAAAFEAVPPTPITRLFHADATSFLADALADLKEYDLAEAQLSGLLEEYRAMGDVQGEAQVFLRRARIARRRGANTDTPIDQARRLLLRLNDRRSLAMLSWEEASVALDEQQFDNAHQGYDAARDLFTSVGDASSAAMCENALGEVARKTGRTMDAYLHYMGFLSVMEEMNHRPAIAWAWANLGWTSVQSSELEEAAENFQRARAIEDGGDAALSATVGLALIEARAGRTAQATALLAGLDDPNEDEDAETALQELMTMGIERT
jgi:tetratricopeptide (TPR) repeat protein